LKYIFILLTGLFLMGCQTSGTGPANVSSTFQDGPRGAQQFCMKYPDQCRVTAGRSGTLATVQKINRQVNSSITPRNDRGDSWDIKVTYGDCEDYVVEKRRRLLAAGWASKDVQIAIGTIKGQTGYHAVLVVDGKYVLDNLTSSVLTVNTTRVNIFMIQSENNPKHWRLML